MLNAGVSLVAAQQESFKIRCWCGRRTSEALSSKCCCCNHAGHVPIHFLEAAQKPEQEVAVVLLIYEIEISVTDVTDLAAPCHLILQQTNKRLSHHCHHCRIFNPDSTSSTEVRKTLKYHGNLRVGNSRPYYQVLPFVTFLGVLFVTFSGVIFVTSIWGIKRSLGRSWLRDYEAHHWFPLIRPANKALFIYFLGVLGGIGGGGPLRFP